MQISRGYAIPPRARMRSGTAQAARGPLGVPGRALQLAGQHHAQPFGSAPETFHVPLALAASSLRPDQPLRITTYVSSSGPVEPASYATGQVSDDERVALAEDRSNFDELERAILDEPEGTWIIDFADPLTVDALRHGLRAGRGAARASALARERSSVAGGREAGGREL